MTNDLIDRFNLFIEQVNVDEINTVWSMQSSKFRDFWKNKIMDNSYSPLSDSDIDEIILILDKKSQRKYQGNMCCCQYQDSTRRLGDIIQPNKRI